jgi:3-oxoacyl-[acyl-carrier protein] reductase
MAYNLDGQVIKRMGTPEDIAEAVLYFASKEAGYTTGQVLKVCGGAAIG